jgi:hypothetical protein
MHLGDLVGKESSRARGENELLLLGLGEGKPLKFGALMAAMEGILVLPSVMYGG